ncbi:permease [Psychromonas ossibalaenae]|uniref:permease n=1 Tax=Psychromonas ossibalaenae TaxID=444922 RepID=UPI0003630C06|nr:permease [Psychromonas ossibalaenae]
MLLLLSILALFLGPLTYRLLQRQPGWLDLLDAFIFVTISGLVLFHILPEVLHSGGLMVLVLMALGLLAPSWIEKYFHKAAAQAHQATLFLGILGLVLHASIDGSALLVEEGDHTAWLLALGVLLHRFPVGLTVWWLLRPQYGRLLPMGILLSMSGATLAGALFADYSLAQLDGQWLAWFQAFVMGSIMHVVLHRPYLNAHSHSHAHNDIEEDQENKYAAGIGSVLGVVVLAAVLLPHWLGYIEHSHDHSPAAEVVPLIAKDALHLQQIDEHAVRLIEEQHINHEAHEIEASHAEHDHEVHGIEGLHAEHEHEVHEIEDSHAENDHEVHGREDSHAEHDHEVYGIEDPHAGHDHAAHDMEEMHTEQGQNNTALTLANFTNIALHSAPMLLLAYFLSALMHYFKPAFSILPMQGSRTYLKDGLKGVIYGLPLPVCSPSAAKMHQQLLGMGANQTFATAFLIATPIIGFDALLISLPLLGTQMLLLRIVLAAVFALSIAWLLGRHFKAPISSAAASSCQGGASTSRFLTAIKQGYQHQLDHTAPWVLLGWTLAATLSAASAWTFFEQALWLQVLVMIVVAFPFALCATGITPVIAVLLMAGLSPGAAAAFFLIAPTISLELLKNIRRQQGIFAAMSLAMLMSGGAFLTGLVLNQYIEVISLPWLEQHQTGYSWWQYSSLVLILCLYFTSLLRRGARAFIAELLPKGLLKHHHHH